MEADTTMEDRDRPTEPLLLVDAAGRVLNETPVAHMITVAAAKLFALNQRMIVKTVPEFSRCPKEAGRGFTTGVAALLHGLQGEGVNVPALLKKMGLFP